MILKIVLLEKKTLGDDIDLSAFSSLGKVELYETSTRAEAKERIIDADVIVMNKLNMDEDLLQHAKKVKLICITATGTNNIDLNYTKKRNITVANVKSYSTSNVVQVTFSLLFYLIGKLPYFDNYVKSGEYAKCDIFTHLGGGFSDISNLTWGIVGLGEIGRSVADVARAFGSDVIYYSTSGKNNNPDYRQVSFDELLEQSDIISVHAPLNKATENLFDENAFKKMKKTAIFLNLGRGPIVVEKDLAKALEEGEIAGAGLDVLCKEPIAVDNPLGAIKDSGKLIITPHIGWASRETRQKLMDEVYKNIVAFKNGENRNIVE